MSSTNGSSCHRGKGGTSTIGSMISAPIRGYYYPGRVKAIKKTIPPPSSSSTSNSTLPKESDHSNGQLIYSIQFSNPLDSYGSINDDTTNRSMNDEQEIGSDDSNDLILDYSADQLIGRMFEPITRALLLENQKVFITYRNRECKAIVLKHDTSNDQVSLIIDKTCLNNNNNNNNANATTNSCTTISTLSSNDEMQSKSKETHHIVVRLNEIRLLPSRKSARIQEHPDYSLLASNGRKSPHENETNMNKSSSNIINNNCNKHTKNSSSSSSTNRHRNQSGSSILLTNNDQQSTTTTAYIDVPQQPMINRFGQSNGLISGKKRRPQTKQPHSLIDSIQPTSVNGSSSQDVVMDECAAALVLMSLSASPRSPSFISTNNFNDKLFNNQDAPTTTITTAPKKLFQCTWRGCKHRTFVQKDIEQHVRIEHLSKQNDDEEMMSGDEEFYYTELDVNVDSIINDSDLVTNIAGDSQISSINHHNLSSGPDSPLSASEFGDASSNSSSCSGAMIMSTNGDNSMDSSSNPPSPTRTVMNIVGNNNSPQQLRQENDRFSCIPSFVPVQNTYRHLEDHEYNRKPDPAGISILGAGTTTPIQTTIINRRGRKSLNLNQHQTTVGLIQQSHPINIPNNVNYISHDHFNQHPSSPTQSSLISSSSSFGGFNNNSLTSSFSSGFGSFSNNNNNNNNIIINHSSYSSSFSPTSTRSGSFTSQTSTCSSSSSFNSSITAGKYLRIANNRNNPATTPLSPSSPPSNSLSQTTLLFHQQQQQQQHRTSPTKRVRGETRKCRKVYGMDKKDSWCTQCKWKKACSRFTD